MKWSGMFAAVALLGAVILPPRSSIQVEEELLTQPLCAHETSSICKSLVFVSTLDGRITVLDAENNGDMLWTMETNRFPLLQSTLSKVEIVSGGLPYRLLPSLDGSLYMYNEVVTQGIPLSVESLLSSSTKVGSDVIVGSKDIITYGVDPISGQIFYTCSSLGCEKHASENFQEKVVIRRVSQVVRAVDATTGYERWNVTVGEHQILLANGFSKINSCGCAHYDKHPVEQTQSLAVKVVPPDGIVFAVSKGGPSNVLWTQKFESPIAKVWVMNSSGLQELSLFDPDVIPALQGLITDRNSNGATRSSVESMIYMGNYGSEHYIIPSAEERRMMQSFSQTQMGSSLQSRLYLAALAGHTYHVPLLSSDNMGLPTDRESCTMCSAGEVNEIVLGDHDENSGWYLYNLKSSSALQKWTKFDKYLSRQARVKQKYLTEMVVVDVWDWWKHAFIVCFTLICIPQIFVFIYVFRKRTDWSPAQKSDSSSSVKKKSQESMTDFNSFSSASTESDFTSRYLKDFVPVRCLGCGGFGTVVESVNKVDEQKYAIKRIPLPNREYAKEMVIREVKALAKLDHPGIVRYYNSWFEEPPVGWLSSPEAALFNLCHSKQSSSGTESHMTNDHSCLALEDKVLKPKHKMTGSSNTLSTLAFNYKRMDFKRCDIDEEISNGSLEIVFEGTEKNSKQPSATSRGYDLIAKSIDLNVFRYCRRANTSKSKKNKELQTVPVGQVFLFIQMQLCREYTLMDWLGEHTEKRDLPLMLSWFKQMVEAMQYVHDCGMIHRDLKPTNIFFSLTGQVKIGDFGLVKECLSFEQCNESDVEPGSVSSIVAHTQNVGTYLYMSPEQETKVPYTFKVDIYALGLIFVELVIPFATQMERIVTLKGLRKMSLPDLIQRSASMCNFVMKTLSHCPEERPSCKAILSSPLFTDLL
uniref:non-specific serine/threonine protein kinase n=1 Tax=Trichuris muris TaxID=70415 RepID=A0A5S6QJV5_TRIMR